MRLTSRLSLIAVLAATAAGCMRSVPILGSPCPCPDGYTCCLTQNACVKNGDSCSVLGGASGMGGGTAGAGGVSGMGGGGATVTLPPDAPGPAPLRRLTLFEYRNTVRELLGDDSALYEGDFAFDVESASSGFLTGQPITGAGDAIPFMRAAERLAGTAMSNLQALIPGSCIPPPPAPADQETCVDQFIKQFGLRVFRRPLTAAEVASLHALHATWQSKAASPNFRDGIRILLTAMLQSPYFLYRWEEGDRAQRDGGLVRFDSYEMASRLSYFLWASMPDQQLFALAAAGKLTTPDQIAAEARRLLFDPKAREAVADFHAQWLRFSFLPRQQKDPSLTAFSPQVAQSMLQETAAFAGKVLLGPQASGKLDELLTSPATFIDAGLARIYNVPGVTAAAGLTPAVLDPAQRGGILTQGSFLASNADGADSNPVKRGDAVLAGLLCVELMIPAGVVIPPVPDPGPNLTTRERFEQVTGAPCAQPCHSLLAVGYAFENYDAIGAYRTVDNGRPVDASGSIPLPAGQLTFNGAVDLGKALAVRPDVQACVARQWLRYGIRRREYGGDEIALRAAGDVFRASGRDLRELIVALTRTRAFTHRLPARGEAP